MDEGVDEGVDKRVDEGAGELVDERGGRAWWTSMLDRKSVV